MIRFFNLLLCLVLLLSLSACATKDKLLCLIDPDGQEEAEEIVLLDSETTPAPPPELLPEPVEAERCIAQELDALRQTGSWTESQESGASADIQYDFPVVVNKQVKMYLELFQGKQKKYFRRWLARSTRYLPLIQHELQRAGLPRDLAYLAMIESGFNQRAYSRASAVGMWQFMRGTGRDYNLRVDRYVDERRDAVKSTRAAVAYLKDLYEQFNDWHLAVAAYNGGPGKIRSGLRRYKLETFWELAEKRHLRLETKRYVPKLIAAIMIAKDPAQYGFEKIDYAEPLQFETIEVGPGLSVDALALISGGSKKELRLLNQELKTGRTPLNTKKYLAKIPAGSMDLAQKNLARLHSVVRTSYKTHIIAENETLQSICRRYKINATTLLKVNNLHRGKLRIGQRLRIPYNVVDYRLMPEGGAKVAGSDSGLILHTIKPGETISTIARSYAVPKEMIASWNGLANIHKIRAGQQLALYIIDESTAAAALGSTSGVTAGRQGGQPTKSAEARNAIILTENNKQRPQERSSGQDAYSWYMVKDGDTLWTISRRFNTSPRKIRLWNNLKSNLIHPGNRLKLKDV